MGQLGDLLVDWNGRPQRNGKEVLWNPWHGCEKISAGCANCYVYRGDMRRGLDASVVHQNQDFGLPLKRKRNGDFYIPAGSLIWTCFSSDYLLEEADTWRMHTWEMMRQRQDCTFFFITKRITRLAECVPSDWGSGYPNVGIGCTVENNAMAALRLPVFRAAPVVYKTLACEPLLEQLELSDYLGDWLSLVMAGGESGEAARICKYPWILHLRRQCMEHQVPFWFKQTGTWFEKDARLYHIPRRFQHSQARKAGIDFTPN